MAEITSLREAIAASVEDGSQVAMEGFTHLIPYAAGHEVIRQGKRNLRLVRMTPDLIYDQLIGMGCASRLTFSWGGNPGVGSLHRFRDAIESSWPAPLEIEEHSHADMAARYQAGASRLPFSVVRGYVGSDIPRHSGNIRFIDCPFTGEQLAISPALNPDVAILHAQKADRRGNVLIHGIIGIQKEAALAAKKVIVTVEEIVEELNAPMNACVLPDWVVTCVCKVPGGAHPSYAHGYYARDNAFYKAWDAISGDRKRFVEWMNRHVLSTSDFAEFRRSIALDKATARPSGEKKHRELPEAGCTPDEMMTVAAARKLTGRVVCFVGIGLPSAAANLARIMHAPEMVLIYESGTIGAKPHVLPLSIGDGELAETADTVVSVPEIFRYWLQGGRIDVGFLGASQIDKYGRINTTVIGGTYEKPEVRLPGAGGAPEIATSSKEVLLVLKQTKRSFVEKLDFVTSSGYAAGPGENSAVRGRGPTTVITDLGVMVSDPQSHELILVALHPGIDLQQVRDETGWPLKVAPNLEQTAAPTEVELEKLRDLYQRTAIAHGVLASANS